MSLNRIVQNKYIQTFLQSILTGVVILAFLVLYGLATGSTLIGKDSKRTFDVEGTGTVKITPDVSETTFTITENGKTQEEAQSLGNEKQNKAIASLKSIGFKDADIKTVNYSINPDYQYGMYDTQQGMPNRVKPAPAGYVYNNTTQIKTTDVAKMNKALDTLPGLGINVNGVNYTTEDEKKYQDQARTKAVEDARGKAESLAKAAGFRLGKIASIREGSSPVGGPYPVMRGLETKDSGASVPPTNINPGSTEVYSQVTISYYILD